MQISEHHEYAADPQTVYAMLTNEDFQRAVVATLDATSSRVSCRGGHSSVQVELAAPVIVRKFVGDTLNIDQSLDWAQPGTDGSTTASIEVMVVGMPAQVSGTVSLAAGGKGTTVDYEGDFVIGVPLVGKKLESVALPYVRDVINSQQAVGNQWLAQH